MVQVVRDCMKVPASQSKDHPNSKQAWIAPSLTNTNIIDQHIIKSIKSSGTWAATQETKSKTTRPCEHPFKKMPFFHKQFLLNCGHCKFTVIMNYWSRHFMENGKERVGYLGILWLPGRRSPQPGEISAAICATSGKGGNSRQKIIRNIAKKIKTNHNVWTTNCSTLC